MLFGVGPVYLLSVLLHPPGTGGGPRLADPTGLSAPDSAAQVPRPFRSSPGRTQTRNRIT